MPLPTWSAGSKNELRSTRRRQLADVYNQVETSASWSSIQYNLLEVKHTEK